jgi:hypothetical protein
MFPIISALCQRLFQRRVRLRAVRLSAEGLRPAEEQLSLFEGPTAAPSRMRRLMLALDRVRDRFGPSAVRFGRTAVININAHR